MRDVESALRYIDRVSEHSGKIVSLLIALMIASMAYEVVMRYIFNAPTLWAFEMVQFLFGAFCILGGAYTLKQQGHVNMDVLYSRFSRRNKAIIDLITSIFFFLFCGVLLWTGSEFALRSLKALETSYTPWDPPLYPIKLTIPIGVTMILLQGIAKFSRDLLIVLKKKEVK